MGKHKNPRRLPDGTFVDSLASPPPPTQQAVKSIFRREMQKLSGTHAIAFLQDQLELKERVRYTKDGKEYKVEDYGKWAMHAAKLVVERAFGKPKQVIVGDAENPIRHTMGLTPETVRAINEKLFDVRQTYDATLDDHGNPKLDDDGVH